MPKSISLENITNDLRKFVNEFSGVSYNHSEFHQNVRRSFADLYDLDESELTISDGISIPPNHVYLVKLEILKRLKLIYRLDKNIVSNSTFAA